MFDGKITCEHTLLIMLSIIIRLAGEQHET